MSRTGSKSIRARVIRWSGHDELEHELRKSGSSAAAMAMMVPKASFAVMKVTHLSSPQAIILKLVMLSAGGDAAIPFECVTGKAESPSALMFGTEKQIREAIESLRGYAQVMGDACECIERALAAYLAQPKMPATGDLCVPAIQKMFREMSKRTLVMGIINVTPDSFSDGGEHENAEAAIEHGIKLAADGADILDVGGQSTRPGAEPVDTQEELERVLPVIRGLAEKVRIPISVDTSNYEVADFVLMSGANMINDVTGLTKSPAIAGVCAHHQAPLVIMHMKGTPRTMQEDPQYDDMMSEIHEFLDRQVQVAIDNGVPEELIFVDPGFGFGKTVAHNLELLKRISELRGINRPILLGTSRKSTLGVVTGTDDPQDRVEATAATVALAVASGVKIVRVHDVREMCRVAKTADAIVNASSS